MTPSDASASPPSIEASALEGEALRARRLRQLAHICMAALTVAAVTSVVKGDWVMLACVGPALLLTAVSSLLARRQRNQAAALTILWTLAPMAALVMWSKEGIYSPAILIFPAILTIASMTLDKRHSVALLGFIAVSLGAMHWAAVSGAHRFEIKAPTMASLIYVLAIICAFAAMILLLAGDLQRALARVREEVKRVQEASERQRYLSEHDLLTGLPNRRLGESLFDQALHTARRNGKHLALLFVNIDNFKAINDSFGQAAGDAYLRQAAERLRESVRESDVLVRHGGDEFLILLPDAASANAAGSAALHVLAAMSRPFSVRNTAVSGTCSIGVAIYPGEGETFEMLVKKADLAVHHAKEAGRNAVRFFDEAMNADMLEDLNLSTSLAQAIEKRELSLHYQGLFDLASGRLLGAEALLRWQHGERGAIPPGRFIPIAERSGLIVEIGQWVIDEACRQLRVWQDAGLRELVLSVNVSTVQFKRGTIDMIVSQAIEKHGIPPASLELEVTESALIHDAESFVAALHRLKALGVGLAIDDFGTGYSNLSYLQRFEVDKLKIDQSFVRRLTSKEQDQAIVRAIVQMARSLKLRTLAEGIEDEATARLLRELGCEEGQGYHYCRPIPIAQFEAFAREKLALIAAGPA